jgi:hypothetical protein
LGALQSADALFLCDLLDGKLDAAVRAGIGYARILSLGAGVLKGRKPDVLVATEKMDLSRLFEDSAAVIIEKCHENVPLFVLAPLFMGACARKDMARPDLGKWRSQLFNAFGVNDRLSEGIDLLAAGFRASVDESEEDIRRIKLLTSNPAEVHEHLRILPFVIACALNPGDLRELLSFQVSILLDQAKRLRGTCWTPIFCRMLATRWTAIAERQPFRLVAPRVMADSIVRAASSKLFGPPQCARLLQVAAQAVGASWSRGVREQLNEISSQLDS